MSVRTLLRSLTSQTTQPPTRSALGAADRRLIARRLLLEGLEDRRLMAFNVLDEYDTNPLPLRTDLALTQIDAGSQLDLVILNGNNTLSVRLGNADGTFGSAQNFATAASPHSVVARDFTGDLITDLVTADNDRLSLLVGNGNGSFQPPVTITLPWQAISSFPSAGSQPQYPSSVATGDLNGDGKLDLVVPGQTQYWYCPYGCYSYGDGYVNVLLGNGSGGFSAAEVQPLGRLPGAVAMGDLNNDGQVDVITTNGSGMSVLLGDGTGAVGSPIHSGSGGGLSSVSLGDIDGDGFLDTVLRSGNELVLQKGRGDGVFTPSTRVNMETSFDDAVVGDVNADGKLDLVAISSNHVCTYAPYYCEEGYTTKKATVVLGIGQGNFSSPNDSPLGILDGPYDGGEYASLALADLTGDGFPELVAADRYASTVLVAEGNWPPADAPFISIGSTTTVERDAGSVAISLTVNLSAPYTQIVTANYRTNDGTAAAGSDYQANSGMLTFTPGQTTQTINLLVYGDRLSEDDESFSVLLSNVVNANVGSIGSVTILENEPRVSINHAYGIDPLTVIEGDGGTTPAVFTVSLAQPYDQEVTVDYYTSTGHTSDIIAAAGTLRLLPGQTSATITVQVVNDLIDEPLEAFNVYISSANAVVVNGAAYCYIQDNDPSSITISDASIIEGNSGTKLMTFSVSLSNGSGQGVSVNYATANGTATVSNNDYVAKSGTIYFAAGEMTKTVTVTIKGDTTKEQDERFYVNLSAPSGGTIADSQGIGTILNDDVGGKGNTKNNKLSSASATDAAIEDLMISGRKKQNR